MPRYKSAPIAAFCMVSPPGSPRMSLPLVPMRPSTLQLLSQGKQKRSALAGVGAMLAIVAGTASEQSKSVRKVFFMMDDECWMNCWCFKSGTD